MSRDGALGLPLAIGRSRLPGHSVANSMPPSKKSTPSRSNSAAAKASAKGTVGAPSTPVSGADADPQVAQLSMTNEMVAAMPFGEHKRADVGETTAKAPLEGTTVEPPSPLVGASTLSESNGSAKTGDGATPGVNATIGTLDRVRADATGQTLTTNQGVAIADNQNSLKAGLRGPTLLEDFILREKITHFDHERIPERVVHARGNGAHGVFECTRALADLTKAAPFQFEGKETPVFVRFSTVLGERGAADTAREVRGFAVKFYTDEGNWDLVGNNIPVFFIQDALKFPDLIHAGKPEPHHQMPQASTAHDTFWDFISLSPESTHMMMWAMSDRAIPRSYRMMQGFGVHTFRLVNAEGASVFCKFHWQPVLGTHSLVWDEAVRIAGADSDFNRRDLWEAIESGAHPQYDLGLQIFTEDQADAFSFDHLDSTKLVPEELVPVQIVGRMTLNRNPDNFFAETEQVAFCTHHVVPGIDFSDDPLLHGRNHSYLDTQITRLGGPNFHEIPINAPIAPVANNQRDALHRQAIHRGRVNYEPNSLAGGCPFQAGAAKGFVSFPRPVEGPVLRGKPEKFADHYTQARLFYESQTPVEQAHIAGAFRFELSRLTVPAIRERMLSSLRNASEALATEVADGLGMALPEAMPRAIDAPAVPEVVTSPALSLMARPGDGDVRTRKVALVVGPGSDGAAMRAAQAALVEAGAVARFVAARLGNLAVDGDEPIAVDATFENSPGVLFDAMIVDVGGSSSNDARAKEFVQLHYRHCKTLMAIGDPADLFPGSGMGAALADAGDDPGVILVESVDDEAMALFVTALGKHRHYDRETDPPAI